MLRIPTSRRTVSVGTPASLGALAVLALCSGLLVPGVSAHPEQLSETALLACPEGEPPDGGWPLIVLLHGYGVDKQDFDELIEALATENVAAVALDAPYELGPGRRRWPSTDDLRETHAYVQEHLAPFAADPRYDMSRLHLGGFSQGALHALLLTLHWPDSYGGVLAISPAGADVFPERFDHDGRAHPLFVLYGERENRGVVRTVERAQALWTAGGHAVRVATHDGGHEFPANWREVLTEAVRWITQSDLEGS